MGIFGLFSGRDKKDSGKERKEQNKAETVCLEAMKESRRVIRLNSHAERMGYIKDNCELIAENNRQMDEAKTEYQAVTSYLSDMQKIDRIPENQREPLEDAARNIINLTKERNKIQNRNSTLSDRQYRLFERYEIYIPKEMPAIKESEKYQAVIGQDMLHLEKERKSLDELQEDIISKQAYLKGIAVTTSVIVILLFLLFAILANYSEASFTIPFLLTVLMAMVSALYIFMEARKNSASMQVVQVKKNRQIMLMNKVKIKSVNNRNYLEYIYSKYMVDNYEQLKAYWEEYVKMKDEARRYQSNTELLEFFHNQLIHELKKFNVTDTEIWIYQPTAILDSKEMVEVRHRLNVRRQKLRERIDTNSKQKEDAIKAIKSTVTTYPDCTQETERLMKRYKVQLEE